MLLHCKKELAIFPSPAGMSLTKLSLSGKKLNYSCPGRVWSVTSRLGTGKRLTLFYSVLVLWCYRHFSAIRNSDEIYPWCFFQSSVYWRIWRVPGFLAVIGFGSSLSPVNKFSLFLNLPVCAGSSLLTGGGGAGGNRRNQILRRRTSLVLYNSFNTLWHRAFAVLRPNPKSLTGG